MNRLRHDSPGIRISGLRGRGPVILAILLFTGVLVAMFVPTPSAHAAIDRGSIAGTVTDLAGNPLPGITVSVLSMVTVVYQGETDASGAYQIDDIIASPSYTVRFTDPTAEYAPECFDDQIAGGNLVPVTANAVTAGIDASLEPAAQIMGRLTTATGAPVTRGRVDLYVRFTPAYYGYVGSYDTDQAGQYSLVLKAATYVLYFSDPVSGYGEWWNNQPGDASSFGHGTPLVVASGQTLTGIDAVLDGFTPPPAPGVELLVRPRIKGTLEVGHVVRVSHGVWKPRAVILKYQWYVGGKAITGAAHRRLNLTTNLVGKRLTVRIKAKAAGHAPRIVWTRPTAPIKP
jgi:hypothetical protein